MQAINSFQSLFTKQSKQGTRIPCGMWLHLFRFPVAWSPTFDFWLFCQLNLNKLLALSVHMRAHVFMDAVSHTRSSPS